MRIIYVLFLSAAAVFFAWAATAQQSEKRIALVIGNAAYQAQPLTTAANDAGLIAQTLQAAGFDVVGARDLDQDTLRRSFGIFSTRLPARGRIQLHSFILRDTGYSLKARITLSRSMRELPEIPMSLLAPCAHLTTCDP